MLTPEEEAELKALEAEQASGAWSQAEEAELAQLEREVAAYDAPRNLTQRQEPQAPIDPGTPWYEDFQRGLGLSAIETYAGIKDLIPGVELSDNDKAVLKLMREDVKASGGWGSAGSGVGELLQLAVPASKASKLSKAKMLAADVGLAGGLGALQAPEENQTRLAAAGENALAATLGAGAGRALQKTWEGIRKSGAAEELLKKGVQLTPGQASKGGFVKGIEYAMELFPFTSKATRELKDEALGSLNKVVLQEAAPKGFEVTRAGVGGVDDIYKAYKSGYTKAWEKADVFNDTQLVDLLDESKSVREIYGDMGKRATAKIDDAIDRISKTGSTEAMENLDSVIRTEIDRATTGATPDFALAESLEQFRENMINKASKETREALRELNSQYAKFMTARRAASSVGALKSVAGEGQFNTDQLVNAMRAVGGESRTSRGEAPLQEITRQAVETIGEKTPPAIINLMKGVARHFPSPTPVFRKGGEIALGQTATQKQLKAMADMLREMGVRGSTAGAAYEGD